MTRLRRTTAALALAVAGLLLGRGESRAQFCSSTTFVNKAGGVGNFMTIQAAVNALPTALAGPACVKILDSSTYPEQVTVRNFANNGSSITIAAAAAPPTVNPPAGSTAAFVIANASVNVQGISVLVAQSVPYGIFSSSAYVTLSSVTVSTSGALGIYTAGISVSSWTTVAYSSAVVGAAYGLYLDPTAQFDSVLYSSFQAGGGGVGLFIAGSSNSVTNVLASNPSGVDAELLNANFNTISFSTFSGGSAGGAGLWLVGASSNVVAQSVLTSPGGIALDLQSNSSYNSIVLSSVSQNNGSNAAVYLSAPWNTISSVTVSNGGGIGVYLFPGGDHTTISASTITGNGTAAVYINANANTVAQSVIASPSGSYGLEFAGGSGNQLLLSSVSCPNCAAAYFDNSGPGNLASRSFLINGNGNAAMATGTTDAIVQSTVTNTAVNAPAIVFTGAASPSVTGSYVQSPSTGVAITACSTATVGGNTIAIPSGSNSYGVFVAGASGGNAGVVITSNVFVGSGPGSSNAAIYLDAGNGGALIVSTNVVLTGPRYGVFVGTQTPGTAVWITSNTIMPNATVPLDGDGLSFNGLTTGATVEYNSIYYRVSGGAAGSFTLRGVHAVSSSRLVVDHNRIDDPDMAAFGNVVGVDFLGTTNSSFKDNDVNWAGTNPASLNSIVGLRLTGGSTGVAVTNNVFVSSFVAGGAGFSSATVVVDAASQAGFVSNYNDYFSRNGVNTAVCGGISRSLTQSWACSGPQDVYSIFGDPLWVATAPGAEDFHPKSPAGRYNPATGLFVNDVSSATSPTIDAGDPAEPFANEPAPNGLRANLGSYANTPQASLSPAGPCAVSRKVCKNGTCPNATIQGAVNSIPNPLVGYSCVQIEDAASYPENVTVANFALGVSSIAIQLDPALSVHPVLSPTSNASPGFLIQSASVTVTGLDLSFNAVPGIPYGIQASSPNVTISSVNVFDPLNDIANSAIAITSGSVVSYSTVSAATANGVLLSGSNATVADSGVTITGAAQAAGHYGVYLNGSASATLTRLFVSMANSGIALFFSNASGSTVSQSTFNTVSAAYAVDLNQTSNATLTQCSLYNGGGTGLRFSGWFNDTLTQSTVTAKGGTVAILLNTTNATLAQDSVYSVGGSGIQAIGGSGSSISSTTIAAAGTAGLDIVSETNDVVRAVTVNNTGGDGIVLEGGSSRILIAASSATAAAAAPPRALYINGASTNTVMQSYFSGSNVYGVYLLNASSNTISSSTFAGSGSITAYLVNSSTNAFALDAISNSLNAGVVVDTGSIYNAISGSTISTPGSNMGQYALQVNGSYNSVVASVLTGGAWLDGGASRNSLSQSTMTAAGGIYALYLKTASTNTVNQCYVINPAWNAAMIGTGGQAAQNAIFQSTIVTLSGANTALQISGASTNTVSASVISAPNGGFAVYLNNASSNTIVQSAIASGAGTIPTVEIVASPSNAIRQSSISGTGTADVLLISGADQTVVAQSFVVGVATAVHVTGSRFAVVAYSTATGGPAGLWIQGASSATAVGDYVQGSTAVYVQGSTATSVGGGVLASVAGGASGLYMGGGSAGLAVASSTVQGGALGAGVYVDANNGPGAVVLSTNTILTGPQYGVYAQSLPAGAPLFVTSNTIVPTISASTHTYGLYLASLSAGTSVQNNGIYYRSSGSMGTNTAYAIYAVNTILQVDHNRINEPGMITAGNFVGAEFVNSKALFKFNDVNAEGAGLTTPLELQALNSGNVVVMDNAFLNGLVNPTANFTAALSVDAASQAGFQSDYNAFFAAAGGTAFVGGWGAIPGPHYNLANWQSFTGRDAHSISGDPLFFSIAPGAEDFHPRSPAGRWSPSSQAFVTTDSSASATIDAADPAEPFNLELLPNGVRANQGSYGDTGEASKSSPPPGCSVQVTVAAGGGADYTSVSAALAGIGKNLAVANTCVVVVQPGTFFEEVDVNGFTTNGNRLTIMGHPNVNPAPVIDPVGTNGAFIVANDSVTIQHIDVKPSGAAGYGILATSAAFAATGVNVDAGSTGSSITAAGISVTTAATISASSVTVGNAYGLVVTGIGVSVAASSASAGSASLPALFLNGASSATVTSFYARSSLGSAALLGYGTQSSTISQSTLTAAGAGTAVVFSTAVADQLLASVVTGGSGQAVDLLNAYFSAISASTLTASGAGAAALHVRFSSNNYVTQSLVQSFGGDAVFLDTSANVNSVSLSTLAASGATSYALHLALASTNTVSGCVVSNTAGTPILFEKTSQWNTLSLSTAAPGNGYPAMNVYGSPGTSIVGSYLGNPYASATNVVQFQSGSDRAFISQSTITTAAPGATALVLQVAGSTVSQSVIQSLAPAPNGAVGASLDYHAVGDVFTRDLIQGATAVIAVGATGLTLTGDFLAATTNGSALWLSTGSAALVAASTLTAPSGFGVVLTTETGDQFVGDYVQGSTAVFVTASTGTVVGGSVLFATGTAGIALELSGGSVGLRLSTSVVYGGARGSGVYLDAFDSGLIVLSTNVFPTSAGTGIYGASLTANSALWITSNTIAPLAASAAQTYGIALTSLMSGATIQNNSIVVRQAGSAGTTIGIYAVYSPGLQIDHNRISDPGLISNGGFYAAAVGFSANPTFKFNDVNVAAAAGAPMTAGYGYYTSASPNAAIKDNVFFSSITLAVAGSSATVWMDTPAVVGTQIDYNDYASSTSKNTIVFGTVAYQYPWSASIGRDAHSISVLPYWASAAPGGEDFHPLSQKGRCSNPPACTIFVADSWTAGTIDAADPAEPFALEFFANGGRANLGSYGGTAEASETPSPPGAPVFAAVYASSVTVSFAGLGVGPSAYAVLASTAPNMTGTIFSAGAGVAVPLTPSGLAANTTYTFAVQASWGDFVATNPTLISTPTLAAVPGVNAPAFTQVYITSAAVWWTAGANPLSVTTYTIVMSTSPGQPAGAAGDVTVVALGAGNPMVVQAGLGAPLAPNTTYFAFAAGVNYAGIVGGYAALGSTTTLAAPPLSAGTTFVFVATNTMSAQWSANGNPLALTTYTVVASTASDFNQYASSVALTTAPAAGPSASLAGLSPNTTYYLRVQTVGNNGPATGFTFVGSTCTRADVPALGAPPTFTTVLASQLGVQWGAGANPPGTLYDVMTATSAGFTGAVTSSFTYNLSLSTAGLAVNTSYFFQVAAVSFEGFSSPFLALGSTSTLANAPATAVSTFSGVGVTSFSVTWTPNGNPPGTAYLVKVSTASNFNPFAASVSFATAPVYGAGQPSATFTGLSAFTTYFFEVAALSNAGAISAFVPLGSTTTLPPALLPPALAGVPGVFTTSMTATWALAPSATGYSLVASTVNANPPTVVWASSAPAGVSATTATLVGLQPDTTYFLYVQSLGPNAASTFAAYAATSTLPAPPLSAASTFSAVAFTSFTAAWNGNGNPLGIATYTVVASTAPDFNLWASSVVFSTVPAAGPQASFTGLFANSTYYFAVMAVGNGTAVTPLVPLGSTTTRVADPLSLGQAGTFVAVTSNSLALAWGANANQLAVTVYALVASTAADFNAWASSVTIATAPAAGPSAFVGGLSANTTYFVGIRALGIGVSSSAFVLLGSTSTRADLPAPAAFTGISTGAIVANWTAPANPAGTLYQLQTALDAAFATTVTSSFTYNVSVATSGLTPNTTYFFRALAINKDGVATAFVGLGSTATLANAPLAAASAFSGVGTTSMTVAWLANGNPLAITTYTVQASTDPLFGIGASSVTLTTAPASGPAATLGGLMFGSTYYVRAAAINQNGIPTAWTSLGSTMTALSNLVPLIVNAQLGDNQWRAANTGLYSVSFQDGSGVHLNKFQVATSTTPGQPGAFQDAVVGLSPADSFSTPWSLPAAVFSAMLEGTTNYVSVRVFNNVPDTNTVVDAFYVLKDTTPPSVSGPVAGDGVVRSSSGTFYTISSTDTGSGLASFQYSASLAPGGGASLIPWTNIALPNGATRYTTPWTVNFAALVTGVTNYVSVRATDRAGTTTTVNDAFYVLKDTVGPTVAISSPVVATGFVSSTAVFAGSAASPFGVQGTEVAVFQPLANLYWNPGAGLFNSGAPIWMPASGTGAWTLSAGVQFADGVAYKVIARSSTTFNMYSTVYATASFVVDFATPTVGVQSPVPNSTISSLTVISGTAADPGAAASGVSSVEVQLRRNSDGLWWNWFGQTWTTVPVSTVPAGTTSWSLAPTAQLQANLVTGASYFIAVRASDNALPQNQGNFFAQGATFTFSNPTPPAAVTDLAGVSGPAPGQIALSWHATGAHGSSGIVLLGQYRIFYSTDATAVPSTSTAQIAFSTANVSPGAASGFALTGLVPGGTYFLALALQNTDGNWSAFSNQASTVATPAPLNAILGHVVNSSTQGITAVEVDAWDSNGALVSTAFTLADGSGTYKVGGLTAGKYKLQASWTANGIASSVWQDGIPMGSVGVDFSVEINYALATLTGSLATLTTASARTGTSPSALARPSLSGSYVELAQSGKTVSRVGVEPSGRWTIPNLLPGAYAVRAYTGVSFTDYQTVTLAEGETKSIGFVFDPLPDTMVYAFPNPARYATTFRFVTPLSPVEAVVDVFDLAGRLVKEIPGSQMVPQPDGVTYHASWDLTNSRGQAVASGVYLYLVKVKGGGGQIVKVVKKLGVVR